MEKINLSEILKHCPEGMKLWSDLYGEVELVGGDIGFIFPISIKTKLYSSNFGITATGAYQVDSNGDDTLPCILWPDSCCTWDSWQEKIMPKCYGKVIVDAGGFFYIVGVGIFVDVNGSEIEECDFNFTGARFANDTEIEDFVKILGEHGYVWDPETNAVSKRKPKDEHLESEPTELEPAVLDSEEADRLYEEYKKFYEEENPNVPEKIRDYVTSAYKVALDDLIITYKGMTLKIEE